MAELLIPYVAERPGDVALTDERGVTTWRELNTPAEELRYVLVPDLPRTPTGKLYKRLLREPYWADAAQPPSRSRQQ
jgi:acyl-CoA synthetase (AMP-forming)/AMP-acid ligase II